MMANCVRGIDAFSGLNGLPDKSIQCCVTSPPYYRLRDYGEEGQYGQEDTPEEYVQNLVKIFHALKRVLKEDGVLWLNLGDTYAKKSNCGGNFKLNPKLTRAVHGKSAGVPAGCKAKDLIGIPWMVAFALRADGWYLRQDIIWHKTCPMPESVSDRCTKAHEYIFLLSQLPRYYFNHRAIRQALKSSSVKRLSQDVSAQKGINRTPGKKNGTMKAVGQVIGGRKHKNLENTGVKTQSFHATRNANGKEWESVDLLANRRSVWSIPLQPSREEHFASFPLELPKLCILAGSRTGDTILDPFAGTGTTLLAASILGRKYIGFDLNQKYVAIAQRRLRKLEGVFYSGP